MATATTTKPSFLSRAKAPESLPPRIVLYGVEGVGKSTFGASAPNPIFLSAEDGIRHLPNVIAFPKPNDLAEVFEMFRELTLPGHDRKTLVVDTVDWLDPFVIRSVCERNKWRDSEGNPDIEAPGYGKGYQPYVEEWRKVLSALDRVRESGIEVILLGHSKVTTFQNPAGSDYARYELAMHQRSASVIKQWPDFLLFANYDDFTVVQHGKGSEILRKGKGLSTGDRVLHTTHHAAWDAKARGSFPATIPLDYAAFTEARLDQGKSRVAGLSAEFDAKLLELNPAEPMKAKILERVGDRKDVGLLERMINWLNGEIAKKG